jgi:dolichol-phosphate mannosyltransferase
MKVPLLSVIIPTYNELATLPILLSRVLAIPLVKEILVIDDGSSDRTDDYLKNLNDNRISVIRHDSNRGKGTAIRTALPHVRGQYVIIQDADLEYNPQDYTAMLEAIGESEGVVYGSRNLNGPIRMSYYRYWLGGVVLSCIANWLYGLRITDEATGYKLFQTSLLRDLDLQCTGFEFCPEVTAKLGRRGIHIKEVPITYIPRSFEQGKKIRIKDGLSAIWTLARYRFIS